MLQMALTFLVIGLIAAVLGFTSVAGTQATAAPRKRQGLPTLASFRMLFPRRQTTSARAMQTSRMRPSVTPEWQFAQMPKMGGRSQRKPRSPERR